MKFQAKVVIVTGGAQGIGMAVSEAFAKQGAHVILADIDKEAGSQYEQALVEAGYQAHFVETDVANEQDVEHLAKWVLSKFQRIDVVINNAGVASSGTLFTRPVAEWDRVLAVNLRAPYMVAKYCGEALMSSNPGPGVIINMASTRALMSEAHTEPYSASKGGIVALTHSLAISLGPKVRVNAISPGWIEVSAWKKQSARKQPVQSPQDLSQHPVGRVGTPGDIAEACLFLASPEAGFITGTNLVVDGGMTIKMIYEE